MPGISCWNPQELETTVPETQEVVMDRLWLHPPRQLTTSPQEPRGNELMSLHVWRMGNPGGLVFRPVQKITRKYYDDIMKFSWKTADKNIEIFPIMIGTPRFSYLKSACLSQITQPKHRWKAE